MSQEGFKVPVTSDNSFALKLIFIHNGRIGPKFKGDCLVQDKWSFTQRYVVNLFIVYKLDTWLRDLNLNFTLGDYLFGAMNLIKNADPDEYEYSSYGIAFDPCLQFSFPNVKWGKMLLFLELIISFCACW